MKKLSEIFNRILPFAICMIFLIVIFLFVRQRDLNTLTLAVKERDENFIQLAGALSVNGLSIEPLTEVIKGNTDPNLITEGRRLLNSLGYGDDLNAASNVSLKALRGQMTVHYVVFCTGFFLCLLAVAAYFRRREKKALEKVCETLNQFSKHDFNTLSSVTEDDIYGRMNNELDSLGKMVQLKNIRLREEKEETKALVTDISHQLKTPLSALKMCASILSVETLEAVEKEEFLNRMEDQIDRLEGLVSALVNISRLETGMISLKPEPFDLKETVIQAVSGVYLKAQEKNISIEFKETLPLTVPHDIKWTKEAIANVLDNAIKYSPVDSCIQIRMEAMQSMVRLEIEDQGIGICEEDYTNIFKRFYRGKSNKVHTQEGSGVGLYLTRKILEEQGGSIMVRPGHSGNGMYPGSLFVLQLFLV